MLNKQKVGSIEIGLEKWPLLFTIAINQIRHNIARLVIDVTVLFIPCRFVRSVELQWHRDIYRQRVDGCSSYVLKLPSNLQLCTRTFRVNYRLRRRSTHSAIWVKMLILKFMRRIRNIPVHIDWLIDWLIDCFVRSAVLTSQHCHWYTAILIPLPQRVASWVDYIPHTGNELNCELRQWSELAEGWCFMMWKCSLSVFECFTDGSESECATH